MLPLKRPPTHPGEVLLKEFLEPLGVTQTSLASALGIPIQRINTLINGKRGVTAETALLLSRFFKNSPEFWMNLQARCDLYEAERSLAASNSR